jgi:outer membrane protein
MSAVMIDQTSALGGGDRFRAAGGAHPLEESAQVAFHVTLADSQPFGDSADSEDAEDRLRRLVMDPADAAFWQVRIDPVEEPTGRRPLPDVDAAVAKGLKQRYDVARAGHELENARTNVEFLSNQKLPDVRLETSYRGAGLGGTQFLRSGGFPGVVTGTRQRSFADALGQVFTPDYPTWSAGVTVSYPLGRTYEEASLARAQVERRQVSQRIASLQLQAAETIRKAARQVRSAAERVEAARASATLAEQRLQSEQRRYEVGLSTTFLVTQAQRDLLEAQVNLLQTTLDYESSLVNFEAVQLAPPSAAGDSLGLEGSRIIPLPTPTPRGVFRPGGGGVFE